MKIRLTIALTLSAFFISNQTQASRDYKPGTIGYLYEDCQQAAKINPENFSKSWCAAFIRGYLAGAFAAAMKNHHNFEEPKISTPCINAVEYERNNIKNSYICRHISYLSLHTKTPDDFVKGMSVWVEWETRRDPYLLERSVIPHLNKAIRPGKFCRYIIEQDKAVEPKHLDRNEKSMEFIESVDDLLDCHKEDKYQKVTTDFFITTSCGAYKLGIFTGIYITDTEPAVQTDNNCASEIAKIRKRQILARDACLPDNIEPEKIKNLLEKPDLNLCQK